MESSTWRPSWLTAPRRQKLNPLFPDGNMMTIWTRGQCLPSEHVGKCLTFLRLDCMLLGLLQRHWIGPPQQWGKFRPSPEQKDTVKRFFPREHLHIKGLKKNQTNTHTNKVIQYVYICVF